MDKIRATRETSPVASPEASPSSPDAFPAIRDAQSIGTPESDTAGPDLAIAASPPAELEAELGGTPAA